MKRRYIGVITFLLLGIVVMSGCALLLIGGGVAAGAGAVMYVKGELESTEEVSFDRAWYATEQAMDDMNFFIVERKQGALESELTARGTEDKKISVKLKKVSDSLTEIRIRVGTFGDESLSRLILEKIRYHF